MRVVTVVARLLLIGIVQVGEFLARRFCLGVTLETQLPIDRIQEIRIRSSMGGVAGEAPVFTVDGLVFRLETGCLILVALETQLVSRLREQCRLFGGVWIVAREAVALFEGSMLKWGTICQIVRIMALEAEFAPLCQWLEGSVCIWAVMACFALGPGHGIMEARLQELRLL